jgi:hypothetical protein
LGACNEQTVAESPKSEPQGRPLGIPLAGLGHGSRQMMLVLSDIRPAGTLIPNRGDGVLSKSARPTQRSLPSAAYPESAVTEYMPARLGRQTPQNHPCKGTPNTSGRFSGRHSLQDCDAVKAGWRNDTDCGVSEDSGDRVQGCIGLNPLNTAIPAEQVWAGSESCSTQSNVSQRTGPQRCSDRTSHSRDVS